MEIVTVIETSPEALATINAIKERIEKSPTGVSFFGVQGYRSQKNELSNFTLNLGVNYEKSKASDIAYLEGLDVTTLTGCKSDSVNLELARVALIESLKKPDENRSAAQTEAYEYIAPNVKMHKENGKLYIFGSKVHKKILEAGVYKPVNSRPLTIAKNELRKGLKSAKCRLFILDTYSLNYELFAGELDVNTEVYGTISLETEED